MARPSAARLRQAVKRIDGGIPGALLATVFACFLFGGGSRADILSLSVLRPLTVLLLAWALYRYGRAAWSRHRLLLGFAAAVIVVALLNVIPLPPSWWAGLPGRDLVAASYRDLGAPLPWLPLTLSPAMGWNALFSLAGPLALIVAGACASRDAHRRLVLLFIALALVSGILGLLQVAGHAGGPLYLYEITNDSPAVGLFANRNHDALFLGMAFPLLALFWNDQGPQGRKRMRRTLLLAIALAFVPMLLLTGSRGGLLAGAIGAVGAVWIAFRGRPAPPIAETQPRRGEKGVGLPKMLVGLTFAGACVVLLAIIVLRSAAFDRLTQTDPSQEMRLNALPIIWRLTREYWPLGSGAGSFEYVYQRAEPLGMVGPQYLNHAHDDWLEALLTYGLPGAILMAVALSLFLLAVTRLVKLQRAGRASFDSALGWCGGTILAMTATLSLFDYPLRVPAIQVVVAIAAVWLSRAISRGELSRWTFSFPSSHVSKPPRRRQGGGNETKVFVQ
jgi:O-antigen ligase